MTATFTPPHQPQIGTSLDLDQRTLTANFGDGYEQIVPDGLNSVFRTAHLTWNGLTNADSTAIVNFFNGVGKSTAFQWTFPGDTSSRLWRLAEPLRLQWVTGRIDGIQVTIRQVFDLL